MSVPVLDGRPAEELVELDGLVGGDASLVLRGLRAQPEVDVLFHTAAPGFLALQLRVYQWSHVGYCDYVVKIN